MRRSLVGLALAGLVAALGLVAAGPAHAVTVSWLRSGVAAAAVLLVLSGCDGASTDGSTEAATPPVTPDMTPADDLEARTWQEITERDLEPFLENYRQSFGTDPPTAELVRYIDPREIGRVMAECMREDGWPARENADGGLGFTESIPDEQAQAQQESWLRCKFMYPVHPMYLLPYD